MIYRVHTHDYVSRPVAVVRARMPLDALREQFPILLNRVYDTARSNGLSIDGRNVFVYRGNAAGPLDLEIGVGVDLPFAAIGDVVCSDLPHGEVAATTHWGEYEKLGAAHAAVLEWCAAHHRTPAGPRWEVYAHWHQDPAQRSTDVYYLLTPHTNPAPAA